MKSNVRKRIVVAAVGALLFGAGMAGVVPATPVQAYQGIRAVTSVCDWDDVDWGELSATERRQWVALGWSQMRWESDDDDAYPASAFKEWEDLNVNEQAAAWSLGYTPRSWDTEDCE